MLSAEDKSFRRSGVLSSGWQRQNVTTPVTKKPSTLNLIKGQAQRELSSSSKNTVSSSHAK
eukprot:3067244-Karenia_brevis.AAC.1